MTPPFLELFQKFPHFVSVTRLLPKVQKAVNLVNQFVLSFPQSLLILGQKKGISFAQAFLRLFKAFYANIRRVFADYMKNVADYVHFCV